MLEAKQINSRPADGDDDESEDATAKTAASSDTPTVKAIVNELETERKAVSAENKAAAALEKVFGETEEEESMQTDEKDDETS